MQKDPRVTGGLSHLHLAAPNRKDGMNNHFKSDEGPMCDQSSAPSSFRTVGGYCAPVVECSACQGEVRPGHYCADCGLLSSGDDE